jgi:hypothetical protein
MKLNFKDRRMKKAMTKTIRQAACEYAAETLKLRGINHGTLETIIEADAFTAGAKFAQQWISVKDKLPPAGKVVLLKFNNSEKDVSTGYFSAGRFESDFPFRGDPCTH